MKDVSDMEIQQNQDIWHRATWYRALSLQERAHLREEMPPQWEPDQQALKKAQRWQEQPPFQTDTYFERRLATVSLSYDAFLALLSEDPAQLQARLMALPPWLIELREIWALRHEEISFPLPESAKADSGSPGAFLPALRPFLMRAWQRLERGVSALVDEYGAVPFDPQAIVAQLFARLPVQLLMRFLRTAVLELNVARVQGRLQGATPEERFQRFIDYLARQDGLFVLLEEYAVLARILVETLERWIFCMLELMKRLCLDWEEIQATFFPDQDPGLLVEIQTGKGDTHRGGRSVAILGWQHGQRLVYKPRSLSIDVHFQELLRWCNERGCEPAFRPLVLLNRGDYGWIEFIEAQDCTSEEAIERFYRRQGGYLALLYALQAADFHAENVIASGEHPFLVDLEALLQPRIALSAGIEHDFPEFQVIAQSVLRIGLLPQRIWSGDEYEGIDVSGLGGKSGQLSPSRVPILQQIGTDQAHIKRERILMNLGQHRPTLNGKDVDTLSYCESIVAGFTAVYHILMREKEVLGQKLTAFAEDEIRCVLRPTRIYGLLLEDSFHPNVLRDGLDRDRLFDRLWIGCEHQPHMERLISAEHADLWAGDIPMFTTRVASYDLISSRGERIEAFFCETGLERSLKQVAQFSEEDLMRQLWVIRAAFTSMTLGTENVSRLSLPAQETEVSSADLLQAARSIGERLQRLVLRHETGAGWLGVVPVNERSWHLLPAGTDLYNGLSGIVLFLAYLGKVANAADCTELAREALKSIRYQLAIQRKYGILDGIGAFSGLGSYVYLFTHLGALWQDKTLYEEARSWLPSIAEKLEQDSAFDVIGGAAGCIAALLSLYQATSTDEVLMVARRCGDHLLASAQEMSQGIGWRTPLSEQPLTGFAHGNAGIALSLLRLFVACGEERYLEAARKAVAYERSLFSEAEQNWPDLRDLPGRSREQQSFMVAWCHGASGIALSRLGMLSCMDDAMLRAEIGAALKTTLIRGFGLNHSLCHGDFGNLEALLLASQRFQKPEYEQMVHRLTAALLVSIQEQGIVTGVPQGVETPGLMLGLAGVGYALLRLAAPQEMPSVLLLDPPRGFV
ncbi:lanthionine synthetase [Thermosporothrix hazakensis]|nr:lanthionine synthetase [Thermosporothrix sp. COM3]GCE46887.1 lanthionine synthetase [Thermosporothrix hazakensis]